MNLDRLRWGEWIAAIAALDLLLVTFRAWYKVSGGNGRVTGWDALNHGKYLLIATAVVGIFLWLVRAAEDTDFPIGWVAAAIGFACTVYVAYRLASPPADTLDADIGLYLGLASALGVTIGGLISAREPSAYAPESRTASEVAADTYSGPSGAPSEPLGALVPDSGGTGTWSPAAPAPAAGWSPAASAAPVPPATTAGAATGERALQAGDSVVLTAGGARFPAGTVAEVVEVFAGGALVEVRAPDGMAERFEVPESAYEAAPAAGAGAAGTAGESWSPALPAPASEDWGFDESAAAAGEGAATQTEDVAGAGEPKPAKTPWWKRDIGGGKKKKDDDDDGMGAELAAAGAVAAGAAALEAEKNGARDEKPGFFRRMFGGGGAKDEPATETLEAESTPATDVAGIGQAAESDSAVDEGHTHEPEADLKPGPGPEIASDPDIESASAASAAAPAIEPEPTPAAPEPEPEPEPEIVPDPDPEPEPEVASAPDIAPEPSAPEADIASAPEPDIASAPEPEPEASAPEPDIASAPEPASDPEPAAAAPEPVIESAPEPASVSEPEIASEPAASDEVPAPPAPEPTPEPPAPDPEPEPEAAAPAAAAAASAGADDEAPKPKPKRKRSSGSRKVPKEALAGADASQPKVGDEVQLKVGGGKYGAGTKGTVVDVFSAGVIVELSDDEGRTERLDLPFEAIGPADA